MGLVKEDQDFKMNSSVDLMQYALTVDRGDIAGRAGIGVGPPGASQVGLELKDLIGLQVQFSLKTDRSAHARETTQERGQEH